MTGNEDTHQADEHYEANCLPRWKSIALFTLFILWQDQELWMAIKAHPAAKCPNYTHKKSRISSSTWNIPCATFIKLITVKPAAVASTDISSLQKKNPNPCLHLAPPASNPPKARRMLLDGHQPLCHTGIFTRPFQAVSSLFHSIFSGFHLPFNFAAHPPLPRAFSIKNCPSAYMFVGRLFLLLAPNFPASSLAVTLAAQALHCCPRLEQRLQAVRSSTGCGRDAVLTNCVWDRARRPPTGATFEISPARAGNWLSRQAHH